MAVDSVNATLASLINPASVQSRPVPEAQEKGPDRDKDADNKAKVQASSSNPPPPPHRGQSVDIRA